MEQYALVAIPLVAGYLGWLTSRVIKLVEVQASTVAKLEAVNIRMDRSEDRLDALYVRG